MLPRNRPLHSSRSPNSDPGMQQLQFHFAYESEAERSDATSVPVSSAINTYSSIRLPPLEVPLASCEKCNTSDLCFSHHFTDDNTDMVCSSGIFNMSVPQLEDVTERFPNEYVLLKQNKPITMSSSTIRYADSSEYSRTAK
ncbi:hypothetical protein Ciccas_006301 [Cichlidogyrus casuarinus]|uniref:Uncharacterized protein n=1 Tax=Cichlidogyrus casuarinus TaxID=1844966 RepID=A0ABD2Q664_9PLAT